jgi:hypothetical protein
MELLYAIAIYLIAYFIFLKITDHIYPNYGKQKTAKTAKPLNPFSSQDDFEIIKHFHR